MSGDNSDKPFSLKEWFDQAQESYTEFEDSLWDKLGGVGKKIKAWRSKPLPDWKRVQNVWIWIAILAFVTGWNLAGYYYEYQCNKHIVEEFYPEIACINPGLKCDMERVNPEMLSILNQSAFNESVKDLPLLGKSEG